MVGEDEIAAVLRKMVKQRQDSIAIYIGRSRRSGQPGARGTGHRVEFLPKEMDEAEVKAAIGEAIAETGAAGPKDMGRVIAAMKAKYAGRIDFGRASALVKSMLG